MSSPCVFVRALVFSGQNEEKRSLSLGGHVGFDSLPDQLVSKSVTQGFCFNILCVGECRERQCAVVFNPNGGIITTLPSSFRTVHR